MTTKKPAETAKKGSDLFQEQLKPNAQSPAAPIKDGAPVTPIVAEAAAVPLPEYSTYIVVVEDSATNLTVISGILKNLNVGSHSYKSAVDAIEFLKSCPDDQLKKIVAIFSDYDMPKMNGIQLLEAIRSTDRIKHLPFMMISSSTDRNLIQKAAGLGIHGYLLKPITQIQIQTRLTSLKAPKAG